MFGIYECLWFIQLLSRPCGGIRSNEDVHVHGLARSYMNQARTLLYPCTGSIPDELANLTRLRHLELQGNDLKGTRTRRTVHGPRRHESCVRAPL